MMTDRLMRTTLAFLLLLAPAGCAKKIERVDATYNRSVDFAALKSYNWRAIRGLPESARHDLAKIRRLVDADLQGKALQIAEDNPDFLVVVLLRRARQFEMNEVQPSTQTPSDWLYAPEKASWSGPLPWSYEAGTMVIDFVRPGTNHMVWRGMAKIDLTGMDTPEKRDQYIAEAVRQIMAAFPPP